MPAKFAQQKLGRFLILAVAASFIVSAPAQAGFKRRVRKAIEAQQSENQISIIIPLGPLGPVAKGGRNHYGLLAIPTEEFVQDLTLTDPTKLENAYFKIVEDESSDALSVGDFDGDNVLYHLMEARSYYAKLSSASDFPDPALQNKIIVRVRVDHGYNLVTHFDQWNDYNNSRYIPASFQGNQTAQWNQEIWFDAQKKELNGVDWYSLAVGSGLATVTQSWIALSATPLEIYDHYNAGIDASKQPGVIFHEAFHYSTDTTGIFPMASEGNPVAEDYANYFGASILGRPTIADLEPYSGRFYKRDYHKIQEVKDTKPLQNNYNAIPFGPSVMWRIREMLGQARADQMIWNSLKFIDGTFLETDEEKALSQAAHEDSALSASEVAEVDDLLNKYHQSYVNLELKANPGEVTLLDEEALQAAAEKQSGNPDFTDAEKNQAKKSWFKRKVVAALNKIAGTVVKGLADGGKGLGYAGSALFAAGNAPVDFGTDLLTGLVLGHGMLSENDKALASQMIGASGGIASTYYSYVGLSALGFTLTTPLISASYVGVLIDTSLCQSQDPQGTTNLARYCVENGKITAAISRTTAKGGAVIGDAIHKEAVRIGDFFVGLFQKKNSSQPIEN